jgi:hypothetical protein
MAAATRVFPPRGIERLSQDLDLHRLATQQALEFPDLQLEFADAACSDDVLVRPDRLEASLGHTPPPPEQEAGGNAVNPGNGRDRHAGPGRLLDQPDLLLGTVASPALPAGDDFDALDGLRHRRAPRLEPRSSGLRQVSGSIGGRSSATLADPPPPPPRLPFDLGEVYRARVADLREMLAGGDASEALEAARVLVSRVVISPPDDEGGPAGIELVGEFGAMQRLGVAHLPGSGRAPASAGSVRRDQGAWSPLHRTRIR